MFPQELIDRADRLLALCRRKQLMLATAESCTGGLIGGLITSRPGSSQVYERGFITYANEAKQELLQVSKDSLAAHGAVSRIVAGEMARGALQNSRAQISVAVTGIAGPGGGTKEKPVGLVYIAVSAKNGAAHVEECRFGDTGREQVRLKTVGKALDMLIEALG